MKTGENAKTANSIRPLVHLRTSAVAARRGSIPPRVMSVNVGKLFHWIILWRAAPAIALHRVGCLWTSRSNAFDWRRDAASRRACGGSAWAGRWNLLDEWNVDLDGLF